MAAMITAKTTILLQMLCCSLQYVPFISLHTSIPPPH